MKCVTPLVRIWNKGYPDDFRILPKSHVARQLAVNPNYLSINSFNSKKSKYEFQEIPCGKCYACRLTYSAEWATRILLEKEYYKDDECWFITLTYDEDHLPVKEHCKYEDKLYVNDGTWGGTLVKSDLQKFIKRIRKDYPSPDFNIKFFACGEYGSDDNSCRPHFHVIIMGLPLKANDMYDVHVDNKFHKEHYKNKYIDKKWKYGMHDIGHLEWSNAAYTARYCMKKIGDTWDKEEYAKRGKEPEFVTMSRDIGRRYYEDHKDKIWKTDGLIMKTVKGNIGHIKPPKRYLTLLEKEDIQKAQHIKESRRAVSQKLQEKEFIDESLTDLEKLLIKSDNLEKKNSMLKRDL